MKILVTGGAGFLGSALIRFLIKETEHTVLNLDRMGHTAVPSSLVGVARSPRYNFIKLDVADRAALSAMFASRQPDAVIHLAAEMPSDRAGDAAAGLVAGNVAGAAALLEAARIYWQALPEAPRAAFRMVFASTAEVFGPAAAIPRAVGCGFEDAPYRPSTPYAAGKAGADHLARAWHQSYGLPVVIAHGTSTYGPRQFPDAMVPQLILNAWAHRPLTVNGDGGEVRDWLHVDDHVRALYALLHHGRAGEGYGVGGGERRTTLEVAEAVCAVFDRLRPEAAPHQSNIRFVPDRHRHDRCSVVDPTKIHAEAGWQVQTPFAQGIEQTVLWYLENRSWWEPLKGRHVMPERRLVLAS